MASTSLISHGALSFLWRVLFLISGGGEKKKKSVVTRRPKKRLNEKATQHQTPNKEAISSFAS